MPSRFDLIGGAPAIDLVNTVSWRGDDGRRTERIGDFAALLDWAMRAGVLDDAAARHLANADPLAGAQATAAVHRLREDTHSVLTALVETGRAPLEAVHEHVAEAINAARPRPQLPLDWHVPLTRPASLPLEVLRLLRDQDPHRIGRCSDPACGWFFLDQSRNRSRRWCSSQDCGNRDRVNRHHRRHTRAS
jgi:predicted RNA-binding Zn ribbon-like protein